MLQVLTISYILSYLVITNDSIINCLFNVPLSCYFPSSHTLSSLQLARRRIDQINKQTKEGPSLNTAVEENNFFPGTDRSVWRSWISFLTVEALKKEEGSWLPQDLRHRPHIQPQENWTTLPHSLPGKTDFHKHGRPGLELEVMVCP